MKRFALALLLGACSHIEELAAPPAMSQPGAPHAGLPTPAQARLETPPPTGRLAAEAGPASLWRQGPESLFGDRRARGAGDIVTVLVEIDDQAELRNRTNRRRDSEKSVEVPALFGAETLAAQVLPGAGLNPAVEASSGSRTQGDGLIQREERITLRVAATVVDVLPNGHLVIAGSQEVRVNFELRDLQVTGVIRPEDITRANVVTYDKIADARISYGGRGQITEIQRAPYGQRIIDFVSPF